MSRFVNKLTSLLDDALQRNVIDKPARHRLLEMAGDSERSWGVLSLAAVLGWLGAGILGLGVVLLISANWDEIPSEVKLLSFFTLFLAAHGSGIYFRQRKNMPWFAEGMNFLGAGLFIAGIGLISQIYQIDGRPPNAILVWLIAIAPLAWCFRSPSIALMAIFAFLVWLHMEHFYWAVGYHLSPASFIIVDVGVGVAFIGSSALLRDREPQIAAVFRSAGLILLFYSVYAIGFYRHLSYFDDTLDSVWIPGLALFGGAVSLVIGYHWMLPENPALRKRLVVLLGALLGVATLMLAAEAALIPKGPDLKFFDFGWYRTFHATEWFLSIAAWILWFALALWCVAFASRTGRRVYLNAGVLAVGLGVITRFFDLVGGLFETGLAFVVGGGALLATCFAVEYWRRRIVQRIKESDALRTEVRT